MSDFTHHRRNPAGLTTAPLTTRVTAANRGLSLKFSRLPHGTAKHLYRTKMRMPFATGHCIIFGLIPARRQHLALQTSVFLGQARQFRFRSKLLRARTQLRRPRRALLQRQPQLQLQHRRQRLQPQQLPLQRQPLLRRLHPQQQRQLRRPQHRRLPHGLRQQHDPARHQDLVPLRRLARRP